MVGAPVSYSGNPIQQGTNLASSNSDPTAKYAPPTSQTYAIPNGTMSMLLPYNGQVPQPASAPYSYQQNLGIAPPPFPPSSWPTNPYPSSSTAPSPYSSYPPISSPYNTTNTYPPNPLGVNQSQSFTYAQSTTAYPPIGYPQQANNPQGPSGYPYPQGQFIGSYPPPPSCTYPLSNPTNQTSYSMGTSYPPPTTNSGVYPQPPPTGAGGYKPRY